MRWSDRGLPRADGGNALLMSGERVDRYQRELRWAGFSLAALDKFVDALGSYQAALLTYDSFVLLFSLLLLAVTVLGRRLVPGALLARPPVRA